MTKTGSIMKQYHQSQQLQRLDLQYVHTLLNYYVLNSYTSFVRISAFTIAYTHSFVLFGTNIHCREQIIHNSKGPAFLVSCTKDECVGVESTPKFVCNYSQSSLQFSQSGFASAILVFNFQHYVLQQHPDFLLSVANKRVKISA